MSYEEAQAELMILRGLAESGNDLALVKDRIERLYWAVCRKRLRQCKCKNILKDAIVEIYSKLKFYNNNHMAEFKSKARLVRGVILQVNGQHYTNANLTDEVAREFLAKFPHREDWFEALPPATTENEVVAEVAETPEKGAEIAPKEVKSESKPVAPKKKKTAKKRK